MQSRFHRSQRTVEGRRNLVQRRACEESKFHYQAMLFRKVRYRLPNPSGIFRRLRGLIGRMRRAWLLANRIRCGKLKGVLVSTSFQEPVPQNAVQPRGEPATTVETRQASPRLDQRLLRKILGPMAIFAKGHRASPQRRRVLFGELLKSRRLAGLGTGNQLALVVFVCVHRTRDSHIAAERFTLRKIFSRRVGYAPA